MAATDYCTIEDYKVARGIADTLDDLEVARVISAASRQVDDYTGRRFYLDDTDSLREYLATGDPVLEVHDFATTTGLTVVDYGTEVVLGTDFYVAPINGIAANGEPTPFNQLVRFYSIPWADYGQGPTISVTAQWGWAAVPDLVKQATILLAADMKENGNAYFGVIGLDAGATIRARVNTVAGSLINRYRLQRAAPTMAIA